MFRSPLLWLIFIAVAGGIFIVQQPTTLGMVLYIIIGSFTLTFGSIASYILAMSMMSRHVSDQAVQKHVSTTHMWLIMFKRTSLYIFLPAFVIVVFMLLGVVVYTMLGGENKYFQI